MICKLKCHLFYDFYNLESYRILLTFILFFLHIFRSFEICLKVVFYVPSKIASTVFYALNFKRIGAILDLFTQIKYTSRYANAV